MKIDIIGSKFTRKLTEFKNFRFEVNNIVEGQSILSLLSDPYEVTMKDINTTDLNDITVAYRDLNKLLYSNLKNSDSEILLIELLSELNSISEFRHSYYNTSSLELLNEEIEYETLSNIEKFRALQRYIDEFLRLIKQYDKVIFIKILPKEQEQKDFIEGLYKTLEDNVEQKLILTVDNDDLDENLEAPLEFYNKVNDDLRKFSSDNYYNQLLFDESLVENKLSVYINHVEEREYIYELYKNGKPFKSSDPTTNRYFEFQLDEPAKYRIRVNLTSEEVNPRFSQTYEFNPDNIISSLKSDSEYVEIPSSENRWMLNAILQKYEFQGLIGNAYLYPNGYSNYKVFLPEEINGQYIKKEDLFNSALNIISEMTEEEFEYFKTNNDDLIRGNPLMLEFLNYLQMKVQ
ncbi:DUF6270 domain-containing protein [Lacicoccus qingdaonensis]|uniref:Uncharacterized protein n=1 Tax=Lacicoccus qingdaonensis TaxID=576118 RepID=A0A1G9H7A9_9BACL|nr:DUF6270 domain-containing protein [Salinicoccus qingdaonensis]SDL08769.1 hypothetical protein SAMN05216216_1215 [Salinicoccus qingdaonensis]